MDTNHNANNRRPYGLENRPVLRADQPPTLPATRKAVHRIDTISRVRRLVTAASLAAVLLGGGVMAELDLAKQESLLNLQATSLPLADAQDAPLAQSEATATVPLMTLAQATAPAATVPALATAAEVGVAAAPAPATAVVAAQAAAPATATEMIVAQATATPAAAATSAAVVQATAVPTAAAKSAVAASPSKSSIRGTAPAARTRSSR